LWWGYISHKILIKTMTIPEPQTIPDAHGNPALAQLPAEEWAAFVREVKRMSTLLHFESSITDAFGREHGLGKQLTLHIE
jgi:hypothetical protein